MKEVNNKILQRLSEQDRQLVLQDAEFVHVDLREIVMERGSAIKFVDFVESGLFSMLSQVVEGESVEVATVGKEGMIGIPLVMGQTVSNVCGMFCQVEGSGWRISTDSFMQHFAALDTFRLLCQRYAFSVFEQAAQNSACNRLHTIEERCAKWLLLTHDRVDSDQFELTQDFLAQMLGVRRGSVNLAAGTLQNAGLIKYVRGKMTILARKELEEVSCECYPIIKKALTAAYSDGETV